MSSADNDSMFDVSELGEGPYFATTKVERDARVHEPTKRMSAITEDVIAEEEKESASWPAKFPGLEYFFQDGELKTNAMLKRLAAKYPENVLLTFRGVEIQWGPGQRKAAALFRQRELMMKNRVANLEATMDRIHREKRQVEYRTCKKIFKVEKPRKVRRIRLDSSSDSEADLASDILNQGERIARDRGQQDRGFLIQTEVENQVEWINLINLVTRGAANWLQKNQK